MTLEWYKDAKRPKWYATAGDLDIIRLPGKRKVWVARQHGIRISKQEHAKPDAAKYEAERYMIG